MLGLTECGSMALDYDLTEKVCGYLSNSVTVLTDYGGTYANSADMLGHLDPCGLMSLVSVVAEIRVAAANVTYGTEHSILRSTDHVKV